MKKRLEAEVTEAVGRGYYDRADGSERGHRNGSCMGKLDSAEGRIEYAVPQVRALEGWRSEVRASLGGKSEELERLAIEMYARGLSIRDIEAAFTDERGRSVLSRRCSQPRGRAIVGRLSSVCQPQPDTLSEELNLQFDERHATPIQAASRSRIYSKDKT